MWSFDSTTGWVTDPEGSQVEQGYAGGNLGKNPEAINNKAYQYIPGVGPLPVGLYTMGAPVEGTKLGPFAIPLTPDPSNMMGGRSDFYVHGDTVRPRCASEGCIVVSRSTRVALSRSPDNQMEVV